MIPNFRKMRIILVIGVLATLYTSAYGLYVASEKGFAEADGRDPVRIGHIPASRFGPFPG